MLGPGQAHRARDVICMAADDASCTAAFQQVHEPNGASENQQGTVSNELHEELPKHTLEAKPMR